MLRPCLLRFWRGPDTRPRRPGLLTLVDFQGGEGASNKRGFGLQETKTTSRAGAAPAQARSASRACYLFTKKGLPWGVGEEEAAWQGGGGMSAPEEEKNEERCRVAATWSPALRSGQDALGMEGEGKRGKAKREKAKRRERKGGRRAFKDRLKDRHCAINQAPRPVHEATSMGVARDRGMGDSGETRSGGSTGGAGPLEEDVPSAWILQHLPK